MPVTSVSGRSDISLRAVSCDPCTSYPARMPAAWAMAGPVRPLPQPRKPESGNETPRGVKSEYSLFTHIREYKLQATTSMWRVAGESPRRLPGDKHRRCWRKHTPRSHRESSKLSLAAQHTYTSASHNIGHAAQMLSSSSCSCTRSPGVSAPRETSPSSAALERPDDTLEPELALRLLRGRWYLRMSWSMSMVRTSISSGTSGTVLTATSSSRIKRRRADGLFVVWELRARSRAELPAEETACGASRRSPSLPMRAELAGVAALPRRSGGSGLGWLSRFLRRAAISWLISANSRASSTEEAVRATELEPTEKPSCCILERGMLTASRLVRCVPLCCAYETPAAGVSANSSLASSSSAVASLSKMAPTQRAKSSASSSGASFSRR